MMSVLLSYAPLLLLTIAVELAVVAAMSPRGKRNDVLAACVALNLVTHPLATLLSWRWGADMLSLELLVFSFEWIGYSRLLHRGTLPALRLAFFANLGSVLAGIGVWIASTTL